MKNSGAPDKLNMESLLSMGKNIREARLAKGFSLVLLADYAGKYYRNKLERNKR